MMSELKKNALFENCSNTILSKIEKSLVIKNESSNVTILNQGDVSKSLYLVLNGTLLITQLAEDGKIVSLELLKKGNCFGEMAIIDGSPRSATVSSLTNVKLGILSENFVKEVLLNNIDFCKSLMRLFAGIIRKANTQIFSLITANARKRLLLQLLRLSKPHSSNPLLRIVEQGLSHTAIGSFAGISRETVTRLIGELKSDELISLNKNGEIELNVEDVTFELSSLINSVK